jgi:hypothetical protein
LLENARRSVVFSDLIFMELFPSLLDLPNLGKSISDNPTYRQEPAGGVATGGGRTFPDNGIPVVYRKYIW